MAIALTTGSGQTTSVPTLTPYFPVTGSYAYSKDEPGEAIYTYVAGTLDQPSSIRQAASVITDIFRGAQARPVAGQRVDGLSVLFGLNEIWKVADVANTAFVPYYLPMSGHVVLKIPNDALVTPTVVKDFIQRLLGAPCRNNTDTYQVAITSLLRGICRT